MKKKIIIFTSSGGGGHESAARALDGYLKDDYELKHTYIFTEVLYPIDLLNCLTCGRTNGEALYNYLIRNKWFRALNMMGRYGDWLFFFTKNKVNKLIKEYLIHHKPDLVISVIPFANGALLQVVQELDIPFILIPTDLDPVNFLYNVPVCTYEKFWIIIAFDDSHIKNIFMHVISQDRLLVGGFPVRKSFFETKNIYHLKQHYGIPEHKLVVFILMGAAGSNVMYNFMQELHTISFPLHLILVLGRNAQLQPQLEQLIDQNRNLTATLLGVTDKIAELMAISDICITKSGPGSICEAIYSNLPMLLDATSTILKWEQFNHTFVKEHGFGTSIPSYADIVPLVEQFLMDKQLYKQMKDNLERFEKKDLEIVLKKLLADILKN